MTLAASSLWRLFQSDRLVRWACYASIVVVWFALAWADVRILAGLAPIAVLCWWLRRQRERRGWLTEPEVDIDLL
jgi:predicted component of type VI protein secretion system